MDQLLSGIRKTQCIIVTGETDDEHLRNLEMVLQRMHSAFWQQRLREQA